MAAPEMIAFRIVGGIAEHFIMRLPEWANAIVMVAFGATLLESDTTFTQPQFSMMAEIAGENTWGAFLLLAGGIRLAALVLNGTFTWFAPWSIRIRALSASACCFGWFCISLGLFLSGVTSPGWKTYGIHLITDMILAIHLAGQAAKVDRRIRNGTA